MVSRQLPIAGLLALALALPSCDDSGEPQKVAISLRVDGDSCGTEASVATRCTSELWVSVEGASGKILSSNCLTLNEERQSIESIGQLLSAGSNLGTLATDEPLRIYLKVYQSESAEPCQSGAPNGAIPYIEGTTPLVTLGEVSENISLLLRCSAPVEVPPDVNPGGEECTNCGADLEQCLAEMGVSSCQDVQANCETTCQDCQNLCGLTEQFCQSDDPNGGLLQLDCSGLSERCREQCQPKNGKPDCKGKCDIVESACTNSSNSIMACQDQNQSCPIDCEQQNSCLTL